MTARTLAALLLLLQSALPGPPGALAGQEAASGRSLEALVDSLVAVAREGRSRVPGAAVAVVDSTGLALLKGYGEADVETGEPVDPRHTVFHVASLSKPVTATAVLQLAGEGRLGLHADVNGVLDDFRIDSPFDRAVTPADLLTHTAGFDRRILGRMTRDPDALGDLGDYLARRMPRVVRRPGALSVYSNHGFALAGHLVEAITDTAFARAMDARIFRPLGMERTSFALRPELEEAMATGYGWRGADGPSVPRAYVRTVPASMLRTTAADLSRWMRAVLAGGVLDSARFLPPERARQLLRRQRGNHPFLPGRSYGLSEGARFDPPSMIHSGGVPGFTSALVLHEELELGILVLFNSRAGPWDLVRGVLDRYEGRIRRAAPPPYLDEPVPTAHLAGYYRSAEMPHRGPVRIGGLVEQVRVRAPAPGRIEWNGLAYRAVDSLAFRREGDDAVVAFVKDGGRVRYAARSGGEYERVSRFRSRPVQAGLWLGFLGVFLATTGAAAIGTVRRRKGASSTTALDAPVWPLLMAGGAAALNLLFVVLFALGMSRVMADAILLDFGLPGWLRAAFVLPPVAGLLAVAAGWGALRSWIDGWTTTGRRAALTVAAVAALAFLPFLASWGLLGLPG